MGLLGSTTGVKSTQAEWFGTDLDITNNSGASGTADVYIAITGSSVAIAYTVDSGSNWVAFNNGTVLTADVAYKFPVPFNQNTLFNIRKSTAGDVTAALCEIYFPTALRTKNLFPISFIQPSTTAQATNYGLPYANGLVNTTESNFQFSLPYDIIVHYGSARFPTNAKSGNVVVALRDDSASIGALTIGGGVTTEVKSSSDLNVSIAANSVINFLIESTGSGTGALQGNIVYWCERSS